MKAVDIKEKLKDLIDQESNISLLESIVFCLERGLDPVLQEKMISRALKSKEDIKAGRVHTRTETEKILRSRLGI
ncbi:MAG: hypothetical protein WBA74_18100 [Cyclobacteriaceae bacterium]